MPTYIVAVGRESIDIGNANVGTAEHVCNSNNAEHELERRGRGRGWWARRGYGHRQPLLVLPGVPIATPP
jgi:hypothetical protein